MRTTECGKSPSDFFLTEMLSKLSHMQEAGMQILAALRQVSLGFPKSFKICRVNNFAYNLTISPVQKRHVSCILQTYGGGSSSKRHCKGKKHVKHCLGCY